MKINTLVRNSMYVAILCIVGIFSIPLGANIKISLQLLMVLIIYGLQDTLFEKLTVTTIYVLLGLFAPVYAGFSSGITPTFGFVIGLVIMAIPFHFLSKIPFKKEWMKFIIPSLISLLPLYLTGTLFLMFYLDISFGYSLLIGVLPYIGFDIIKIVLAYLITKKLKPLVSLKD